jgi:hypothetical protein
MPKPIIRVRTKLAVDLIRAGASDTVLRETFGLTEVGLGKLFKKLIDAEEIQQFELDRRTLSSFGSQTVDVSAILDEVLHELDGNGDKSAGELDPPKPRVDLKKKSRLSGTGLKNRPKKLLSAAEAAGFPTTDPDIAKESVERRPRKLATSDFSLPEDDPWHGNRRRWTLSGFVRNHKVVIAAFVGGITGMCLLAVGFLVFVGFEKIPAPPKLPPKITAAPEDAKSEADKQVQEATAILEAIARDRNDPKKSGLIVTGASQLEECLENCKKSFSDTDETERIERSNCQKECLHTHSELFKKMRQKYHGQTE